MSWRGIVRRCVWYRCAPQTGQVTQRRLTGTGEPSAYVSRASSVVTGTPDPVQAALAMWTLPCVDARRAVSYVRLYTMIISRYVAIRVICAT